MSLLDLELETFNIYDKRTVPDGFGGVVTEYTLGAEIKAAATLDSSMEARIAQQSGVTSLYTITTRKSVLLDFHDVIKRQRDGKVFRITSDASDKQTPKGANLDIRQATAEVFSI